MKVNTNITKWKENAESSNNKLIERIMLNLTPIAIINETIYLEYIGPEEKKIIFFEYYNNQKTELLNYLSEKYNISSIEGAKALNKEKLYWLEALIQKFEPKNINFSIK